MTEQNRALFTHKRKAAVSRGLKWMILPR